MKFTIKTELENKISFLDILIANHEYLKTSVYQQSTYTGLNISTVYLHKPQYINSLPTHASVYQ